MYQGNTKTWRNDCRRSSLRNYLSQVTVNSRTMFTKVLSGLMSKPFTWDKYGEMAVTQVDDISHCYDLLNILLFKGKNLRNVKYIQALLDPSVHNIVLDPSVHNIPTADFCFRYK